MNAEKNFQVEFTLTVTVKGNSLQSIDDGLVQAAGERLAARMTRPPTLNGQPIVGSAMAPGPVAREEPRPVAGDNDSSAGSDSGGAPAIESADQPGAGGKKRGVKPGSTRGSYKKTAAEEAADAAAAGAVPSPTQGVQGQAQSPGVAAPSAGAPQAAAPQVQAPIAASGGQAAPVAPSPQGASVPKLEDAVAALTLVNTKKNTDIAYKCLTDHGVKRCGELTDANRAAFIAHCHAVANS